MASDDLIKYKVVFSQESVDLPYWVCCYTAFRSRRLLLNVKN